MRISDWSSDVCSSDLGSTGRSGGGSSRSTRGTSPSPGRIASYTSLSWFGTCSPPGCSGRSLVGLGRSDERRLGNECVITCRYWWSPLHTNKKIYDCIITRLTHLNCHNKPLIKL